MLSHFVAVCLALLPLAQCIQIHNHMTEEEVRKTFQTGHKSVPEYEVVRLYHTLHKRDINGNSTRMVKCHALGRELSLYLEPTEGLLAGVSTPVWTVVEHAGWPEETKYIRQPNVLERIGRAYQDVSKMSAIVAYEGEDGEILVHGNLLEDIAIRPLPHRLHDTLLRETRDLVDFLPDGVDGEADFRRSHHHVVFKRPEQNMNTNHHGIRVVEREKRSSEATANKQSERSIPDIVYPEVLIIVDHSLYNAIGKDIDEATRYVLSFWNAVDLRYRLLEEPIIRLNIAGIIISLQPRGTPYLEDHKRGSTEVDADLAIVAMSRYFYREAWRFPFATYDFAMAMTHLDMCNVMYGVCDTSTHGYAYEWGACNRSHVDMNTEAVGIVEDNGGYSGIIPTSHEVAHLLGVPHDGYLESIDCPGWHGYLMSAGLNYGQNSFQWSNCSLKHLYDFLSANESTCLHNEPTVGEALPRLLPGQLLTLDEQCEKFSGTRACDHDARVCTALRCYIPGRGQDCRVAYAAAEGSSCGDELHCINGHCVSKNVILVPYTLSTTAKPFNWGFRRPGWVPPWARNLMPENP